MRTTAQATRPRSRWHSITRLGFAGGLAALVGIAAPASAAEPAVAVAASESPSGLAAELDALLEHPLLTDAQVGISVVDLETGKSLYARGADVPLNPASNAKLVTTSAALLVHGPEHRFVTRLMRNDGALDGSVVKGNVYLRGSGDPELVTEHLVVLASELAARGVKRITGGVVVDASAFDRDELPPGFDQKEELASYRAPSGAVSVNFNSFVLRVAPGAKVGDAALVGIDPPTRDIKIIGAPSTVAGRKRKVFADVKFVGARIEIELRGSIGEDASAARYRYPVAKPSEHAGHVLVSALRRAGIKLGSSKVKLGTAPSDARGLAAHFSRPLGSLIRPVNKFSNNFMAEQILKTLSDESAPATFEGALARVRQTFTDAGLPMNGVQLRNGSGLYDNNRVTPQFVTALLQKMYGDFRYRADFLASLSVMGVDGTTRSRLDETEADRWIRVKTGTLDGISALSGYVGAPGREPLAFCILLNDLPEHGTSSARKLQDEVALRLARFAAGKPLASVEQ